jgi:hypothetical protein
MTHDEATKDGATERYVLEEMTDEEREAFERHYFDCPVCAEDVKAAIGVRDGLAAERVADDHPVVVPFQRPQRRLPASLSAAAAALIAVVSMYAGVVQPQRKLLADALRPRLVAEEYELRTTRGSEDKIIDHRNTFALKIDLETDDQSPSYTYAIVDAAGAQQSAVNVDGMQARKGVSIDILGGTLKPGTYILRVDGTEAGVARYPFTVR